MLSTANDNLLRLLPAGFYDKYVAMDKMYNMAYTTCENTKTRRLLFPGYAQTARSFFKEAVIGGYVQVVSDLMNLHDFLVDHVIISMALSNNELFDVIIDHPSHSIPLEAFSKIGGKLSQRQQRIIIRNYGSDSIPYMIAASFGTEAFGENEWLVDMWNGDGRVEYNCHILMLLMFLQQHSKTTDALLERVEDSWLERVINKLLDQHGTKTLVWTILSNVSAPIEDYIKVVHSESFHPHKFVMDLVKGDLNRLVLVSRKRPFEE